jgi:Lanthionine synthetase C-like protein
LVWNKSTSHADSSNDVDAVGAGAAHGSLGVCHTLLALNDTEWIEIEQSFKASYSSCDHDLCRARDWLKQKVDVIVTAYETRIAAQEESRSRRRRTVNRDQQDDGTLSDVELGWADGISGCVMLLLQASQVFDRHTELYLMKARNLSQKGIWDPWVSTTLGARHPINSPSSLSETPEEVSSRSICLYDGLAGTSINHIAVVVTAFIFHCK